MLSFIGRSLRMVRTVFKPVIKICGIKRKKRSLGLVLLSTCAFCLMYGHLHWLLQPSNVTNVCVLEKINFRHPSFANTFWYESPKECKLWESFVYFDEKGFLQLNKNAVISSGHSNIKCLYSTIEFFGQNDVRLSEQVKLDFPMFIPNDFVHVMCKNAAGYPIYNNLHYKVYNAEVLNKNSILNETKDQLSVIILGVDSLSTLVANRMLHKTIPYLQNKLNAYFMDGYTKVGDNTLVNLAAALMGKSLPEMLSLSYELPTLFREMKARGYIDSYAEDWAPYRPDVVVHLPQYTHNLRRLILARQKVDVYTKEVQNVTKNRPFNNMPLCFGNKMKHKIVLEYSKQFIEAYSNKRKHVFMWLSEISHHQSNFVQLADNDFTFFFEWLNATSRLQNSVVIMMSDHGPRYGPVPKTNLGRFTGRHPFLAIVLPQHLTTRYPHLHTNLLANQNRLTSPFDLYEMLKDIIHQNFERQDKLIGTLPRGISLFREIPKYRSCYDASISADNCACHSYVSIPTDDTNVVIIASYTVDHINKMLHPYDNVCSKLSLSNVESANVHYIPYTMTANKNAVRYTVALQTIPGNALFEVTVDFVDKSNIIILGSIVRRNKYQGQTDCVKNQEIEPFCLCRNTTNSNKTK